MSKREEGRVKDVSVHGSPKSPPEEAREQTILTSTFKGANTINSTRQRPEEMLPSRLGASWEDDLGFARNELDLNFANSFRSGVGVDPGNGLGLGSTLGVGLDSGIGLGLGSATTVAADLSRVGIGAVRDSDEELEAIRGSVRRLREQRSAVERLTEKSRRHERLAQELGGKLREALRRINELEVAGGQQIVWRAKNEASELRSRLDLMGTAFQAREDNIKELRQALRESEDAKRAVSHKEMEEGQKLKEQEAIIREQQESLRRMEQRKNALEERVLVVEKRAKEEASQSQKEVHSLSTLLQESQSALDEYKGKVELKILNHNSIVNKAKQEKENLLFEKGEVQERVRELTLLCERQRTKLEGGERQHRELQRAAVAYRQEKLEAERQVVSLKKNLTVALNRMKEEDTTAADRLSKATRVADELGAQLAESRAEVAAKDRQLRKHRDEQTVSLQGKATKLVELTAQQTGLKQALQERDETVRVLHKRLQQERRERGQWAKARTELLSQFCDEEHKLQFTLQNEQEPGQGGDDHDHNLDHIVSLYSDNHAPEEQVCHQRQQTTENVEQKDTKRRGSRGADDPRNQDSSEVNSGNVPSSKIEVGLCSNRMSDTRARFDGKAQGGNGVNERSSRWAWLGAEGRPKHEEQKEP